MEGEYIEEWTAAQIEAEIAKHVPGYVPDPDATTDAEKELKLIADAAERNARANAARGPSTAPARYDLTPAEQREVERLLKAHNG